MRIDFETYDAIERYEDHFKEHILERGEKLLYDNGLGIVVYDPRLSEFRTQAYGNSIYDVSIRIDILNGSTIGTCNCAYKGNCKHLAALVSSVLENTDEVVIKKTTKKAGLEKSSIKLKGHAKTKTHFITGDSLKVIFEDLSYLPSTRLKSNYSTVLKHTLVGPMMVHSDIFNSMHMWKDDNLELIHSCTIELKENEVTVKCLNCEFKKQSLCGSAQFSLHNVLKTYMALGPEKVDYDKIISDVAAQEELPTSVFEKNGKILLTEKSVDVMIEDPALLSNQIVGTMRDSIVNQGKVQDDNVLQALENRIVRTTAFVWSASSASGYQDIVFVIEGKVNKSRDKLSSHLKVVEDLVLMNEEEALCYKELSAFNFESNELYYYDKYEKEVTSVATIIKQHLPLLRSAINYFYNPNPMDRFMHSDRRLMKKYLSLFSFSEDLLSAKVTAEIKEGLYTLTLKYYIADEEIDIASNRIVNFSFYFLLLGSTAYVYDEPYIFQAYKLFQGRREIKFLPREKSLFIDLLQLMDNRVEVIRDDSLIARFEIITDLNKVIKLKEIGDSVVFCPLLKKDDLKFLVLNYKPIISENKIIHLDRSELDAFSKEFKQLHSDFAGPSSANSFVHLHVDQYVKNNWHLEFFEKCKELDIKLVGLETFDRIKFSRHKAHIETDLTSKIDWFELNVTLTFGDEVVERKKWIKALKEGKTFVELSDGSLGILPEEWIEQMAKIISVAEESGKKFNINKLRFNILDDLFSRIENKSILKEVEAKRKLLRSFTDFKNKKAIPSTIKAELRPYQEASFQWLCFLQSSGFGGILADDMGLGKTLQIICALAEAKASGKCHALVVVPRSLIFNWVNELNKFCPTLSYTIHHGAQRFTMKENMETADVVISTYGTVVNDVEMLRRIDFSHIILDESQAIKNPASKRYKAIRLLSGAFKLCATGTPIQNNTFDLYTQASFANPGLLGNQTAFRKNFANPIDKDHDRDASALLRKMIHPFLLRRTKEQVAGDLPDKVESIIFCDMLAHQRKMYDELKEQIRQDLLSLEDTDGQMKFMVLDGLLRLRQLCNSPLLVDRKLKGSKAASVKIESLIFKLTEEIGEGNALVFSQFVQMLDLIRKKLDERGIPYAYLDGKTQDREAVVNRYMEDDTCRLFLISLKAGNTGLNLTKAQYVFLVDPWWNPASEAQAIDRTHRIGQTKKVFAYKMICKDTVEEKILLLQKKKKKVASQLIQVDENSFKNMSKQDLLALFE